MGYYVIEFQTNGDIGAAIPMFYTDRSQAEAAYFNILWHANSSSVEKHGAMIISDDVYVVKFDKAYREPPAPPEPEPDPDPEPEPEDGGEEEPETP